MKKLIILITSLVIVSVLGWYTYSLMNNNGISNTELIAFNIEDISTVDRILISDAFGNKMEVIKNGNEWTDKDGGCIQQSSVAFILETFKNIEFKGYLPENSREQHIKLMATQHTKVEIYQNGEWSKTWYIGVASQDHYGQVMLLDSDEFGKSDLPVIMKIKGVNGIIEPRFFADPKKWMCTKIFELDVNQIKKVDVKFIKEPIRSFTVLKNTSTIDIYQQGKKLQNVDPTMAHSYLNKFKKVHFEIANYQLDKKQVDSVKHSTPFAVLKLTETNNATTTLRMFKIKTTDERPNEFGVKEKADMDKFWCEMPNGELVKCQYFALNPILLGHVYFPMNIDSVLPEFMKKK